MSKTKMPEKYGDLDLKKRRHGRGYAEYEYVGGKAPSWEELEKLVDSFARQSSDILDGHGLTNIKGAPVAPNSRNCNGVTLTFNSKSSLNFFLERPIVPEAQGVSLRLQMIERIPPPT